MSLVLRMLTESDEQAFIVGLQEWVGESPHWYSFIWKDEVSFDEMLRVLKNESAGVELVPGRVPHSMLYAFLDGQIIGRLSVRHSLNDNLKRRGGNIGYAVAKRFRGRGYATEIVRQGLDYCRGLGLTTLLVTCSDTNAASWKIIEHFNGRLENRVWDDEDKEMIRRYWIELF